MKENKTISQPMVGMSLDTHSSQLTPQQYRLLVNGNTNNEVDYYTVQNEPSNYYGVLFLISAESGTGEIVSEKYKVIGIARTELRTYFFLTSIEIDPSNPHHKRSSIGYVENDVMDTYNQDQETTLVGCGDCGKEVNLLDTPLEEIVQTPSHEYIELVHDRCIDVADIEEHGLNFNINFPIKKVDIKQEKLGTVFYWEDWRNPSRYLQITRIEEAKEDNTFDYLHTIDIACEDPQEAPCLDVDKMLVFPKHRRMWIEPKEEQIGGNLKKGTYEFWGAYCDLYGNEITEYCSPTNPISIWDEYNNILEQTDLDEFTNSAIKLKVHNLDIERFKYYKIAVVERNNVLNTQSVFLAGIYPTTDDIVIYTHSGSNNDDLYITRGNVSLKKRMDFNQLLAIKPTFRRAKTSMISDERRFIGGLEAEPEINLQPVVNIFSQLVKAQTSVSNENLYKSSIATSKYKQYTRNEVQPFAIRFLYKNSGYSSSFPFIGRPKLSHDKEIVERDNNNRLSIEGELSQTDNDWSNSTCKTNSRIEKWQIFNTAQKLDGVCFDVTENSIQLPDEVTEKIIVCPIPEELQIPAGEITIDLDEEYYDLEDYVNKHTEELCNNVPNNPYYSPELCQIVDIDLYEDVDCVPEVSCEGGSVEIIGNPRILIKNVENEISTFVYKEIVDYTKTRNPQYCNIFTRATDGGFERDVNFEVSYLPWGDCITGSFPPVVECKPQGQCEVFGNLQAQFRVYTREADTTNEICSGSEEVLINNNPSQGFSSVIMGYQASENFNDLRTNNINIPTTAQTVGIFQFTSQIHNKAKFFKIEKNGRDKIIFEISKYNGIITDDFYSVINCPFVRYTIFNRCNNPVTMLQTGIVDLNSGFLTELDVTTFPNTFFIVIDSPITTGNIKGQGCGTPRPVHFITPPPSCFGVYQRNIEPKAVTVTWDSITIEKEVTYKETCPSFLPQVYDCDPIPYEKFRMSYWESVVEYPDNKELWDSSEIKIKPSHIQNLDSVDKIDFERYFTEDVDDDGNYVFRENELDFRCKPIRHPKLPDNTVSPYIIDNMNHKKGADSIIFPMGINFDDKIVQTMIEVAFDNNLLTKKQKENIIGWEILRGDNSIHKSVTSSGILFDVNEYTAKNNDKVNFSNFPFNDLGNNKFITDESGNLIPHKHGGSKNNQFTYLSPDIFLTKPQLGTEIALQGYLFGNANTAFYNVKEHSQWTILGGRTYKIADRLAAAEVALEIIINVANTGKDTWAFAGPAGAGGSVGALGAVASIVGGFANAFMRYGQYRYNWLEIFRNLGNLHNFASFQAGQGKHNRMFKIDQYDDNYLRRLGVKKYIKSEMYNFTDETSGETIKLNHDKREHSVFLRLGGFKENNNPIQPLFIEYPNVYKNFDNNIVNNKSSNFIASDVRCADNVTHQRDIANPYIQLKNYIPDQWDTIDSVKWLTTNYIFDLGEDTTCKPIYGGTQTITRFSWRVKVPFYRDNSIGSADKLRYLYSRNSNIAKTRFYCNYETSDDAIFESFGTIFPDIRSEYNFDCLTGSRDFYVKPPSKFYLFTHGIIDFLVESEINCNFRYGKKQPKDQFYQGQSLESWLQEVDLPIIEPNTFYYNNTYTFPVSNTPQKKLDRTYSKEIWDKRRFYHNAWIWSEKDNNENAEVDPFLIYKPLNFYEDKSNRGLLIDLRSIESEQFLARYENQLQLFNQINPYADSINSQNKELGTGFLYTRPITFKSTDLGFAGTQNTDFVSTPYGHFWVDAKRGRIFQVDQNGGNMEIISEAVQGKPTGMKNWFREHLPYKILKYLPEIDVDNKYKGIGMNIWYDDRFSRVFFTKRDYILKPGVNKNLFSYNKETQQLLYNDVEVFFDNETLFKDVSWTISYKPTEATWNSFFTFYPDYSIAHNGFFQIGYNWKKHEGTLWNHLLNNKSFGVFSGEYNPFILEFPVSNQQANKILASLSINIEARRFQNMWEYAVNPDVGMTDMFIYNNKQNSGYLSLIPQKTLTDNRKYPLLVGDKQEILTTFNEGKQHINYFYNRVLDEKANIPHLMKDINNIFSTIDSRIVRFSGKKVLERLKGTDFIVNISNTKNSQFNIIVKNIINQEIIEP